MILTTNITGKGWIDIYDYFGIEPGSPLLIHNMGSAFIKVSTDEIPDTNWIHIGLKETARSSYGSQYLWVEGGGIVSIEDAIYPTIAPYVLVDLAPDVFTSSSPMFRRLRVDPAQTSFFESREFRAYKEFDIPNGTESAVKVIVPEDIILWDITVEIIQGAIRVRTLVDLGDVIENTPFTTPIQVFRKNGMDIAPSIQNGVEVFNGGSISGGSEIDLHLVGTAPNGGRRQTNVGKVGGERGVNPGTYYIHMVNNDNDNAQGVLSSWWEENPFN